MSDLEIIASFTSDSESKSGPLRSKEQIPRPILANELGPEWQESIRDRWCTTNYVGEYDEKMKKMLPLKDRLLSFGGHETCLPYAEEDLYNIL